jgi:hypothetical protein
MTLPQQITQTKASLDRATSQARRKRQAVLELRLRDLVLRQLRAENRRKKGN